MFRRRCFAPVRECQIDDRMAAMCTANRAEQVPLAAVPDKRWVFDRQPVLAVDGGGTQDRRTCRPVEKGFSVVLVSSACNNVSIPVIRYDASISKYTILFAIIFIVYPLLIKVW